MELGSRSVIRTPDPPPEGYHHALFSSLTHAVLFARFPDRHVLDVNDEFCRMFNVTRDVAVRGSTDFMYASHDDFERLGDAIAPAIAGGRPATLEWTLRRHDGSTFPAEITVIELRALTGERTGVLKVIRDLTATKELERREARRREREAFLTEASTLLLRRTLEPEETLQLVAELGARAMADYANVDVFEDAGTMRRVTIAHVDPSKSKLVEEYAARFGPKLRLREIMEALPDDGAFLANDLPLQMVAQHATSDELRIIEQLGVRHHLAVPLVGRQRIIGALGFTRARGDPFNEDDVQLAKDLAMRAALAYENAALYARASASEERLRSILDTAPVQILTIDATGRILTINRSLRGTDVARVIGLNAYDTVVPSERSRVRNIIERVMRTGEPAEYETEGILSPTEVRWFNVRVAPITIDGAPGAVLISTDVHDRRTAEAEISRVRAQLIQGEKLAALGSLVSGVAHELRTPLTYIANNAFLLEHRLNAVARRANAPPGGGLDALKPYIKEITSGVDRINLLVEDLRKYTKARQTTELSLAPIDALLAEAVELFRATNRSSHRVERSLSPTTSVRANRGALQQLLLNLLQNAAEASPPGSTIRVSTRQDGAHAVLEVADQGQGIPDHVKQRMFDPLYTTKPEGTGLGLSIVKRIADDHSATIEVETTVGRGTTFRVRFPTTNGPRDPQVTTSA